MARTPLAAFFNSPIECHTLSGQVYVEIKREMFERERSRARRTMES